MVTDPKIPGNMDTNVRDKLGAVTSAITHIIACSPAKNTAVHVVTNNSTVRVDTTTDALKSDGTKLADMEDSGILWNTVAASSSSSYFAGDSTLISGVRIVGVSQAVNSGIEYSITQKGTG